MKFYRTSTDTLVRFDTRIHEDWDQYVELLPDNGKEGRYAFVPVIVEDKNVVVLHAPTMRYYPARIVKGEQWDIELEDGEFFETVTFDWVAVNDYAYYTEDLDYSDPVACHMGTQGRSEMIGFPSSDEALAWLSRH